MSHKLHVYAAKKTVCWSAVRVNQCGVVFLALLYVHREGLI